MGDVRVRPTAREPSARPREGLYRPTAPITGVVVAYQDAVLGHVIDRRTDAVALPTETCWLCGSPQRPGDLFQPCPCPVVCHRDCFRQWRAGWINPRNYFSCPTCLSRYNIERVQGDSVATKPEIVAQYRAKVAILFLSLFFTIGGCTTAVALIAYGFDAASKNIPVAVKFMLTSVIHGWPASDAAKQWRREFRSAAVPVWPYYTLLGGIVTAIVILIMFAVAGCTVDENKGSCRDCLKSWSPGGGSGHSGSGDYCCSCNCKCNLKCGGDLGEAAIFLVLIIIIVVLLSAIFVIIAFAVRKWALFHDRMTDMLRTQQGEMEGETVVLGMGEQVRPFNEV